MDCVHVDTLQEARRCVSPGRWMSEGETKAKDPQRMSPMAVELEALDAKLETFIDQTKQRFDRVYSDLSVVKSAQLAAMTSHAKSVSINKVPTLALPSSGEDPKNSKGEVENHAVNASLMKQELQQALVEVKLAQVRLADAEDWIKEHTSAGEQTNKELEQLRALSDTVLLELSALHSNHTNVKH